VAEEFQVQNNSFSAEFRHNGGTIVNMVMKQAPTNFMAGGWWYGQRSAFDALDYFNPGPKPDHLRDQYGFAIGGPIKTNKTFFFADFEKIRAQDPVNLEGIVPTDMERGGDFSQDPANSAGIYDPCAGTRPQRPACIRTRYSPMAESTDKISSEQDRPYRTKDSEPVSPCQYLESGGREPELARRDSRY